MQSPNLDGFLLHRSSDLLGPDGDKLLNWLESLRERGLVARIGVSIYESSELDSLPGSFAAGSNNLSVYDQRLIRMALSHKLQDMGIAVHVRSVFLQGLILQSSKQWPDHPSDAFNFHHHQWLEHLYQVGLSPLSAALGFARACEGIEAVLVGVLSFDDLVEILQAWKDQVLFFPEDSYQWAWGNTVDLDPRVWPHERK